MKMDYQLIRNSVVFIFILFTQVWHTEAACTFPENITGSYISADRGSVTVNATAASIFGYKVFIPVGLTSMDFTCIEQSGSTYLMQAEQFMHIFGQITRFFLCIELQQIGVDRYYYYLGSEYDAFLQDNIFGLQNAIATMAEACNRQTPYPQETYIMLIKDDSIATGNAVINCPDDLLAVFDNVTATKGSTTETCAGNMLEVCTDRTQMNYTFGAGCTTAVPFSAEKKFTCVHYITASDTTFLSIWNNDATITEPTTFQFLCYALRKIGDVVYATETPRFCTNTTTHTTPGTQSSTQGITLLLSSIQETCMIVPNVTTTTTIAPVVNLAGLWSLLGLGLYILLSLLVLLALLLYRKYGCICRKIKCPKRKPKPRPETPDIDVSKGEVNPRVTFTMRRDVYLKQNGMNFSLFRPKKPLNSIFPMFDPEWDAGALPFILPLPRVEPIYKDQLEAYMRDRLPRRKSGISLYSFDNVFFKQEPNGMITHK